jgi:hypothetical protein
MTAAAPFSFVHCADLHLDSPFEGIHVTATNQSEAGSPGDLGGSSCRG